MLNFTEHMKRINYLSDQALIESQKENFVVTRDAIVRISIHCNEALQQLDEIVMLKRHPVDPLNNQN